MSLQSWREKKICVCDKNSCVKIYLTVLFRNWFKIFLSSLLKYICCLQLVKFTVMRRELWFGCKTGNIWNTRFNKVFRSLYQLDKYMISAQNFIEINTWSFFSLFNLKINLIFSLEPEKYIKFNQSEAGKFGIFAHHLMREPLFIGIWKDIQKEGRRAD